MSVAEMSSVKTSFASLDFEASVWSRCLAKFWSQKIRLNELIFEWFFQVRNVERILDCY